MSNWELKRFTSATELSGHAAADFLAWVSLSSAPRTVAISGGRIAKEFFGTVARLAKGTGQSLEHVQFFWADERCVPPDHAESNYRIAAELLLLPLQVPPANIHRIRGEAEPERAAQDAETELRQLTSLNLAGQPILDLVLLGMGEDGHIASLFPGETEMAMTSAAAYRAVTASKPPPHRITLGYAAVAAAREVWVLASGAGKEQALGESLSPTGMTPLGRVLRQRDGTRIFTDLRP